MPDSPHQGSPSHPDRIASAPPAAARPDAGPGVDAPLVGRYQLETTIGEGAIGQVRRATRLSDGRAVAIKRLHPRHLQDPQLRKRFAREVEVARSIDHPGAVQLLDSGLDDQQRPFIVMELVQGRTLRDALSGGDVTPRRVVHLLCQVLSVLQEAHRQGVVHRDLKPENILVTEAAAGSDAGEGIKVCDFGVAKLLRPEPGTAVTMEGMVCGTPEYMAPEQGTGKTVDGRADLYAVGALLYEILCGQPPFQEGSPIATITSHITTPLIAPSQRNPDRPIPRELEAICIKALAKSPDEREQSGAQMAATLKAVLPILGGRADEPLGSAAFRTDSTPAPTAVRQRVTVPGSLDTQTRTGLGITLVAAAVAVVAALGWYSSQGGEHESTTPPPPEQAAEPALLPPPSAPVTTARPEPPASEGEQALRDGRRKLRQNDLAGAVTDLTRAQALLDEDARVLRSLGEALHKLGEAKRARTLLQRYLKARPDARDRRKVEGWLGSVP